jgi:hypothetical protein
MSERDSIEKLRRMVERYKAETGWSITPEEAWDRLCRAVEEARRNDLLPGETPEQQLARRQAKVWARLNELAEERALRESTEVHSDSDD